MGKKWGKYFIGLALLLVIAFSSNVIVQTWTTPPPKDVDEPPDLAAVQYFDVPRVGRIAYWKVAATAPIKADYPLLYLAGGPGSGISKFEALSFSQRHPDFDIYFLDQISVGASDRLARTAITLESSVAAIDQFSNTVIGTQVVVNGASWGAAIAARFAVAHPERVRALLLSAPAGLPEVCAIAASTNARVCSVNKPPDVSASLTPHPIQRLEAASGPEAGVVNPTKPSVIPDGEASMTGNRVHLAHLVSLVSPSLSHLLVPLAERHKWEKNGFNVEVNKVLLKHHQSTKIRVNKMASEIPVLILRGDLDFVPTNKVGGYQFLFPKARFVELKNETHNIEFERCVPLMEARSFLATNAGAALPKSCVNKLVPTPDYVGGYTLETDIKF